jgi:GNAT superfamily N-acetyltransferase
MSEFKKKVKLASGIHRLNLDNVKIRNAEDKDVEGIFHVASSVGKKTKDAMQGYLMDDYTLNPEASKEKLRIAVDISDFFYVAEYIDHEYHAIVGFTYGFRKENWLKLTPEWSVDSYFRPDFDNECLENFMMLDKIAVLDRFKRQGVGSMLSKRLIKDIKQVGIYDIFEEVIIAPVPNLPSVLFKTKRNFKLASMRYEKLNNKVLTTLIYHRKLKRL